MAGLVMPSERSVIIAADIEPECLQFLVTETCDVQGVDGYKIGFEVGLGLTLKVASDLIRSHNNKAKVIYDHQKGGTDNQTTAAGFARTMQRGAIDAAILFPLTGPPVEDAYVRELQQKEIGVIVGAEMTNDQFRQSDGGYIADDAFKRMFEQAIQLDVRDFVVPGNKPDKIADYREFFDVELGKGEYSLYAPGFGLQGGVIREASEIAGPNFHAFVGRAITEAANIHLAAMVYTAEILGT